MLQYMVIQNTNKRVWTTTSTWWRDPSLRPEETRSAQTLQQNNKQQHKKHEKPSQTKIIIQSSDSRKRFQELCLAVFLAVLRSVLQLFSAPEVRPNIYPKDHRKKNLSLKSSHYFSIFKATYHFIQSLLLLFARPPHLKLLQNALPCDTHALHSVAALHGRTCPVSSCAFGQA